MSLADWSGVSTYNHAFNVLLTPACITAVLTLSYTPAATYSAINPHVTLFQDFSKTITLNVASTVASCGAYTISSVSQTWVSFATLVSGASETVTVAPTTTTPNVGAANTDLTATFTVTMTDHITVTVAGTLYLRVSPNPCYSTTFRDQTLASPLLTTSVLGATVTYNLVDWKSEAYYSYFASDGVDCGDVTYELVPSTSTFLSLVEPTMTMDSNLATDTVVGTNNFVLRMKFTAYEPTSGYSFDKSFTVLLNACVVISTSVTAIADQSKIIGNTADDETVYPTYTLTPACGYTTVWSNTDQSNAALISIFDQATSATQLEYATSDLTKAAAYPIRSTALIQNGGVTVTK